MEEKKKTQKVTLTNTGPGAFILTDAEGFHVEVPGKPEVTPTPPAAPSPTAAQPPLPEGVDPPWIKEIELDEAMIDNLKKRQEKGSPLHVGREAEHKEAHKETENPHKEPEHNKTQAHAKR
jgi:hypothetical protein